MTGNDFQLRFGRMEKLIGADGVNTLRQARIAVVGVGGVGSFVVEALARAGVGWLVLVDHDQIELSNTNRQLPALTGNYGRPKVEVMAERVKAINPRLSSFRGESLSAGKPPICPPRRPYLLSMPLIQSRLKLLLSVCARNGRFRDLRDGCREQVGPLQLLKSPISAKPIPVL